ncbi:accessory gene regulator B family protein, partial [Priestia aryabhattai]|uniref:accessory gene regulator B family protein n=1 Tax=Priestia aryabhattai TaxID=412384 RepID=UPI0015C64280
ILRLKEELYILLEKISYKWALYLCSSLNKEPDLDILKYGIEVFLKSMIKILSLLFVGVILHNLPLLLSISMSFILLRLASGGFHFSSYHYCYVVSISLLTLLSVLSKYLSLLKLDWTSLLIGLNLLSITLLLVFKTSINVNRPNSHKKKMYLYLSIALIIISILVSLSIKDDYLSFSIGIQLSMFSQVITLVKFKEKEQYI